MMPLEDKSLYSVFGTSLNDTLSQDLEKESADVPCYSLQTGCTPVSGYRHYHKVTPRMCQNICSLNRICKGVMYDTKGGSCKPLRTANPGSCKDYKQHSGVYVKGNCNLHKCQGDTVFASICALLSPPFASRPHESIAGTYVGAPLFSRTDIQGSALLTVSCSKRDYVMFQMETVARHGNADSFFLSFDGGEKQTFHVPNALPLAWKMFPQALQMTKGLHTLRVSEREDGTLFRRVKIIQGVGRPCTFMPNPASNKPTCTIAN